MQKKKLLTNRKLLSAKKYKTESERLKMDTTIQTKTNILVVDDQIGMLETFTDILEDRGFSVVTADDGFTAIEKVKKQSFDLIDKAFYFST